MTQTQIEKLGPAETILSTLLTYSDHMVHNRPGHVTEDATSVTGVRWQPVTYRVKDGDKVVFTKARVGKKTVEKRVGVLAEDGRVREGGRVVGRYQAPGLFPEVAAWMYRQVAEVWTLDNEFCARWASFAFTQEHRDLKVVLAAFMLVQSRKGDPVKEGDEVLFDDEDFRAVGEAMLLLRRRDKRDLNPKLLLRVHDLLSLPAVAAINRELGFGRSARTPFLGRWTKAIEKWLRNREDNPKVLEGLVKAGFRTSVMALARRVRYKPTSPRFFEVLRWKQAQAADGHREVAVGVEVTPAPTWAGLTEMQVCERIVAERPDYKRLVGLVPAEVGLTRAVMAAAVEAGSLSDKDLVILTPTLEDLGLLGVQAVKSRWTLAVQRAEDQRAANIARRVKSEATKEALQDAADAATKAAVEEVMRNLRVYFMVDISGSMASAIEASKGYLAKFLQAFPQDRLHVSVFNTRGREIAIRHASAAGVEHAFRGIAAGGGTDYGAGVRALEKYRPADDEDVLFFFVGDEKASLFMDAVTRSKLSPVAFGLVRVESDWGGLGEAVQRTAQQLALPCFTVDERTFEDPYAVARTIRALIASTPVGKIEGAGPRVSLVDQILSTELLAKPAWAA